jgi:hypothetical protein
MSGYGSVDTCLSGDFGSFCKKIGNIKGVSALFEKLKARGSFEKLKTFTAKKSARNKFPSLFNSNIYKICTKKSKMIDCST